MTNTTPVNKQAAMLFWKSPWWAKCPETSKKTIKAPDGIDLSKLIDYTCPAPRKSGGHEEQCKDWRGVKIIFDNGDKAVITGYADEKRRVRARISTTKKNNGKHYWWATKMNGVFFRMQLTGISKNRRRWEIYKSNVKNNRPHNLT